MANYNENTQIHNSTYNVLYALAREADFLYFIAVDKYIQDVQNEGRQNLLNMWNEIKQDKKRQLLY